MESYQKNLVSIITPVYNAQNFIEDTIESVIKQTYQDWELILVNDCSQDQTLSIIENLAQADSRIKIISLASNQGAAVARNTGLDASQGQYVAFIDSDDAWHPEKLAKQLEFMNDHGHAFSYTAFALVDEEGQVIKEKVDVPASLNYHQLLKNTAIACSTVIIDRKKIGNFHMPLVRKGQDTATWLQLMRQHGIIAYGLNDVLNKYRQVAGSISSNRLGALKRTWNTYYRLEKLPLWKAVYYFSHYVFNAIRRRL